MCGPKNNPTASPKHGRKSLGIPDQKELLDQKAAHECLTRMILDCKKLFMVRTTEIDLENFRNLCYMYIVFIKSNPVSHIE